MGLINSVISDHLLFNVFSSKKRNTILKLVIAYLISYNCSNLSSNKFKWFRRMERKKTYYTKQARKLT